MRAKPLEHGETIAAKLRSDKRIQILSPFNHKTPRGEAYGYLQAVLFLAPHTLAGGKNLCAHSTEACREGCLFTAGRGKTPRVENARLRRTHRYLNEREAFLAALTVELELMQSIADRHGLKLAIRLNGTSDVLWERERVAAATIFDLFPRATFFDYTRTPAQHRKVPENWRLTFSLADDPLERGLEHLRAGRSIAAVVPDKERAEAPGWFALGAQTVTVVDGELHDLRFLDPPPAVVLLKPKGRLRRGGPMVRPGLIPALMRAHREARP